MSKPRMKLGLDTDFTNPATELPRTAGFQLVGTSHQATAAWPPSGRRLVRVRNSDARGSASLLLGHNRRSSDPAVAGLSLNGLFFNQYLSVFIRGEN